MTIFEDLNIKPKTYLALAIPAYGEECIESEINVHACTTSGYIFFEKEAGRAFFPVKKYKLFWEEDEKVEDMLVNHYECFERYAVVAVNTRHVFATVTKGYCLILHREAYELLQEVAQIVFGASKEYMIPQLDVLTNYGAACEISLRRQIETLQPRILGGWKAIVKMGNSYNKTKQLSYDFGFEYEEFGCAFLLPDYTIRVKDPHARELELVRKDILRKLKSRDGMAIQQLENEFVRLIEILRSRTMSTENMLRLFCKMYMPKQGFKELDYVYSLIMKFSARNQKKTAYMMLLVFSEYVKDRRGRVFGHDMQTEQLLLGKWVSDFVKEVTVPDFSFHNYFGAEICDLVSEFMSERGL